MEKKYFEKILFFNFYRKRQDFLKILMYLRVRSKCWVSNRENISSIENTNLPMSPRLATKMLAKVKG